MYKNSKVILFYESHQTFYKGHVLELSGNRLIGRCKSLNTPYLRSDENVLVAIYNNIKGEIIFTGKMQSVMEDIFVVSGLTLKQANQKRQETRVRVSFLLNVKRLATPDEKVIELGKKFLVWGVDLSASGVQLYSPLDIPADIRFFLELPVENEFIPCIAKIVRKERKDDLIYYGCCLWGLSEVEKDRIRGYVFKKQIEERKNWVLSMKQSNGTTAF